MADPFIFISTYRVLPEHRETYEKRFRDLADLVAAEEPKMLYFAHHETEDGSEGATVQVHSEPENMALHMQLVADHVEEARSYLDFSTMSIRIFGTPTPEILDQMRRIAGSGVPVSVSPAVVAFDRFAQG